VTVHPTFAGIGILVVAMMTTACGTGPVDLGQGPASVPQPCAALLASVPVVVGEQRIRALSPERPDAAAWGDPPIILVCDLAMPAEYTATSSLIEIDGVSWFPQELESGTAFTSVDRVVNVQIRVPRTYAPEASVVVELSPYVRESLPLRN